MYRDLIIVCMYIYFLDRLSTCLYYLFGPEKKMSHNTRWFFIHSFTNLLICCMAKKDVYDCITDPKSISLSPSYAGQLSIWTAILAHIYHVVVFSHKLTFQDWLHHSLMVGVSGTVTVISPFKLSVLGLWFMSGLPGFIDRTSGFYRLFQLMVCQNGMDEFIGTKKIIYLHRYLH